MITTVGFDFDGTLIKSEDKKGRMMARVFAKHFGVSRGVLKAYNAMIGHGFNRDAKIVRLCEVFLKRPPTLSEHARISRSFGQQYRASLDTCPLFTCLPILQELKSQAHLMFLLSLENQKDVRSVVRHCGLAKYFKEVLGGPKSKEQNFQYIFAAYNIRARDVLYIGDADGDVKIAKKLGMTIARIDRRHFHGIKKALAADFTFSSLCKMPAKLDAYDS